MTDKVRRLSKQSLKLDESVLKVAEMLARHYGVTIEFLIETLLLDCAQPEAEAEARQSPPPPPPAAPAARPRRRRAGRVISLDDARRRLHPDTVEVEAPVAALLRRSSEVRAQAAAACEAAKRARSAARKVQWDHLPSLA